MCFVTHNIVYGFEPDYLKDSISEKKENLRIVRNSLFYLFYCFEFLC